MREAGLPLMTETAPGERLLLMASKGVVRAVYPDTNRVDIETQDGSFLTQVLVMGPYFPEVHQDGDAPSHVTYIHVRGQPEAFCWPETHRRLLGPRESLPGQEGQSQPERRYFYLHGYIFRVGDITVRVTHDNRLVLETEQGDYILLDANTREIHLHAPTVFVGTDERGNREEYQQDDSKRIFQPLILLGSENGDRAEIVQQQHIILQSPTIQENGALSIVLQAPVIELDGSTSITLAGPVTRLGSGGASEAVMLGNLFMGLYNTMITMLNTHVHSNVTTGGGTSGGPTTTAAPMTTAQLSDTVHVSKS
jgi:hypothetical protein